MDRWRFLKINIPKYLANSLIDEIVIIDETGLDYALLKEVYASEPKIKLFKNQKKLGPFLNKLECIKKASNDWVCLIDSDNYADEDYFLSFFSYVNNDPVSNIVYCPSFAKPRFDMRSFEFTCIRKDTIKSFLNSSSLHLTKTFLNCGNFIIHKSSANIIAKLINSDDYIKKTTEKVITSDVMYMNYLLLNEGFELFIVPNMAYEHACHETSLCMLFGENCAEYDKEIFAKVCNL
jgi:glycosyltransferase involved in cell wall biosynthesis